MLKELIKKEEDYLSPLLGYSHVLAKFGLD